MTVRDIIKRHGDLVYPEVIWTQGITEDCEYTGSYEASEYKSLTLREAAEIVEGLPVPHDTDLCPSAIGSNDGQWIISRHAPNGHYSLEGSDLGGSARTVERSLEYLVSMFALCHPAVEKELAAIDAKARQDDHRVYRESDGMGVPHLSGTDLSHEGVSIPGMAFFDNEGEDRTVWSRLRLIDDRILLTRITDGESIFELDLGHIEGAEVEGSSLTLLPKDDATWTVKFDCEYKEDARDFSEELSHALRGHKVRPSFDEQLFRLVRVRTEVSYSELAQDPNLFESFKIFSRVDGMSESVIRDRLAEFIREEVSTLIIEGKLDGTIDSEKYIASSSPIVRERVAPATTERVVVLVICPFCGAKTEQGLTKCQGCGADL